MNPPTGTITFLFTDIEGSTPLWAQHPDAMQSALARHDAILRQAIESHHGTLVKTTGDGVHAAFAVASDALAACLTAQRTLHVGGNLCVAPAGEHPTGEHTGSPLHIRVRTGLHTGSAELRDGDYYGTAVNQAARIMSVAHGGQIVLSAATMELVRGQLPDGVMLRDLGAHRLKGLLTPEQLWQVVAADLPADFPPLKTLDQRPHNLPVQTTPFIGREREVSAVCQQLHRLDVRLLTLTGPGGTGKTRLGLQVAAELLDSFADGVFFVPLASLNDPSLVAATIAQTLGLREVGGRPLRELLKDYLKSKHLLLLLDNFEHVTDAAPFVAELLAVAPHVKALITSRNVLHLYGEHAHAVPPMTLPDLNHLPSLERMTQYEAVQLFIERAQAAKSDFSVTNENAPAVAEICARLDGLPLAIELAAARARLLSPQAILARLAHRLKLLTGGARDLPVRQQTLRDTIAWSYELLDASERMLFARLAVFAGGCMLVAAEAVCDVKRELPMDMLDGLASLVDKSLLKQHDSGSGGEPRFTMLETIREYALERLTSSDEADAIRRHHADFFLALAQEADPKLTSRERGVWMRRLIVEYDNLRAVFQWSKENKETMVGLQLAGSLNWFWNFNGNFSEGRSWLETTLAQSKMLGPQAEMARAKALSGLGNLTWSQGNYAAGYIALEESMALYQRLGGRGEFAFALLVRGLVEREHGDLATARASMEASLTLYREVGDQWKLALCLVSLGRTELMAGNLVAARPLLEEGRTIFREIGDEWGLAVALNNLGLVALREGNYGQAVKLYQEAIALFQQEGHKLFAIRCLEELAWVICLQGDYAQAMRLCGAAEAQREALGAALSPSACAEHDRHVATARTHLAESAFATAWAEGRAMTMEQAVELALAMSEPPSSPTPSHSRAAKSDLGGLTARELEVAALIGQGLSNREIAEQLTLSERTIEAHISHIFNKLDFTTRVEVRKWAKEKGLGKEEK
jgi:predicted ATPase/class 3 adenylate cyclase/DNA-binding CsgD family transcriptional regulator